MTVAAAPSRLPNVWRAPLAGLGVASTGLFIVTIEAWAAMLRQWWHIDTYNHLMLVPFIIAWLVGLKRGELARIDPRPFAPALLGVTAGLVLWRTGEAMDINLVAQAGAVVALQATVIAALGLRTSLVLALPIAFAALLVPFGDEIIPPLQVVTAEIAVAMTHWSGVPARIEGIHIYTPAGLFIVAEACAGVKFLIATLALGVLVCATRFRSWRRRATFMAACVAVPVLANGVRAWGTIYVAQFIGAERATGFDHIVYGWVFFAIIIVALLGVAWRFVEREPDGHSWSLAAIEGKAWLTRVESFAIAPDRIALAVIALAAIAGLSRLL